MTKKEGLGGHRMRSLSPLQRIAFYSKADANSTCVMWTGPLSPRGYGLFFCNGHVKRAHRAIWEIARGPIPSGMCVCHRCDVPGCINIDHLFLATIQGNTADKVQKGRQARGAQLKNK